MERGRVAAGNVRKSHTNTSDLLTWSESAPSDVTISDESSAVRPNKASDGVGKVLFGGQVTEEEAEVLNKRKPCSGSKLKEMTGSKIFADDDEEDETTDSANPENGSINRTSVRIVQQAANGISQISFSTEENPSPKKPTTIPEVAKQRELSGSIETESESSKAKKQLSDAKTKELSGNDIFGPPPEIPTRSSLAASRAAAVGSKEGKGIEEPAPRTIRTSVKVSNPAGGHSNILFGDEPEIKATKKIHNQKFQELTGNDIFKGDAKQGSADKPLSSAKLKEISGNDIFSDGKVESRDYFGGVRKPPGGESSIALI